MMPEPLPSPAEARAGAERIEALCGVVVPEYRWPLVFAELARLGEGDGPSAALVRLEAGDQSVREALIAAVTIPESYLFRHPAHFRVLRRHAEQRAAAGLSTRVLSAGCSTGEEAWSAAATLASVALPPGLRHHVAGWDLSAKRLAHARAGSYGSWSARVGLLEYDEHFHREGDVVSPSARLREMVSFHQVNLLDAPPPDPPTFDVVLLRNVAIYWKPPTVAAVWRQLSGLLHDRGLFLVGPSDPVALPPETWEQVVVDGARCYRRRAAAPEQASPPSSVTNLGAADHAARSAASADCRPRRTQPERTRKMRADGSRASVRRVSEKGRPAVEDELLQEVRRLADGGRYHDALALLDAGDGVSTVAGRSWSGILHLALERPRDAIRLFRQCVFLQPRDPAHRRWLAAAYEAAGMTEEANREMRNFEELSRP